MALDLNKVFDDAISKANAKNAAVVTPVTTQVSKGNISDIFDNAIKQAQRSSAQPTQPIQPVQPPEVGVITKIQNFLGDLIKTAKTRAQEGFKEAGVGGAITNVIAPFRSEQEKETLRQNLRTYVETPLKVAKIEEDIGKVGTEFIVEKEEQFEAAGAAYSRLLNLEALSQREQNLLKERGYLDNEGKIRLGKTAVETAKNVTDVAVLFPQLFAPVEALAKLASGIKAIKVGENLVIPLGRLAYGAMRVVGRGLETGTYFTLYTPNLEKILSDPEVAGAAAKQFFTGVGIGMIVSLPFEVFKRPPVSISKALTRAEEKELTELYIGESRKYHPDSFVQPNADAFKKLVEKRKANDLKWFRELQAASPEEAEKILGTKLPNTERFGGLLTAEKKTEQLAIPTTAPQTPTIGQATKVYRGAKDQTIDVSRRNGITGGVSLSLDKTVAERFAKKVSGTVTEYTISPKATVVNHSVLEALPKDQVTKFIQDNKIDVVRFDVPDGAQGEQELRVLNDKVLTPVKTTTALTRQQKEIVNLVKDAIYSGDGGAAKAIYNEAGMSLPEFETIRDEAVSVMEKEKAKDAGRDVETMQELVNLKKGGGIYASEGGYRDAGEAVGAIFGESYKNLKAIESPELVELARQLSGATPSIVEKTRVRGGAALGFFRPATGKITYLTALFKKYPTEVPKVMAHEIGHLIDFLPEGTMKRGNLAGRLATLQGYLKNLYEAEGEEGTINAKEVRGELKTWTRYWKPFNEDGVTDAYLKYRDSGKELYADAISGLFNDPATLKQKAPKFFGGFFDHLDRKPEVKEAFFAVQDLLNEGGDTVLKRRDEVINRMFESAEQTFVAKELEKQKRRTGILFNLQLLLDDKNQAVINNLKEARKKGISISPEQSPVYALEELNYLDAKIANDVERLFQPSYELAQEVPDGWNSLGKTLLLERTIHERGELANPGGFDAGTAQKQLDYMKRTTNPDDWKKLDKALEGFREGVKRLVDIAEKSGFYTPEMIEQMKANPAYATYQVVDYIDTYISPAVYRSVGTLKDVANPATATVMKTVSVLRAIERNNAKKTVIEFQKTAFGDITPAKTKWNGRFQEAIESRNPDEALVKLVESGKIKGYYADPYIAQTLNYIRNDTLNKMAQTVKTLSGTGFYRPAFTSLNLGFQTFNITRDFFRLWKSLPEANLGTAITSFFKLGYQYGKAVAPSWRRVTKKPDEIIKAMENAKMLGLTYDDLFKSVDPDDTQIERVLQRVGLLERKENYPKIIKPLVKLFDGIEVLGNFIETVPKVAGYRMLEGTMPEKELASFVRTKAGSPDFRRMGTATPVVNNIYMFSNAIKEGVKADLHTATDPKTRSGYWWKTFIADIFPKITMIAAGAGIFGKQVKKMMDDASEYDKTNYIVIPLGVDKNGKTNYLRIPRDETGRIIGGLFWKASRFAKKEELRLDDLTQIFSFGAGQFPNLAPSFTGIGTTVAYMSGQNPYDSFRGRNIIPDKEFKAGFKYSLPIYLEWLAKNQGLGIITPGYSTGQDPTTLTTLQKILALPIISNIAGRWIRTSDYGQVEKNREIISGIESQKAVQSVEDDRKIEEFVKKYQKTDKSAASFNDVSKQLVTDVIGKPKSSEDVQRAKNLAKKFKVSVIRGRTDPNVNSLISATSNAAKAALMISITASMGASEIQRFESQMLKEGIISGDVVRKARYLKNAK